MKELLNMRTLVICGCIAVILLVMVVSGCQSQAAPTAKPPSAQQISGEAKKLNESGINLAKQGQFEQAITDFGKAISIEPLYVNSYINRALAYNYIKEFDKAIADYDKAITLAPNDAGAYTGRGDSYYARGLHDKAIADYNKGIELKPLSAAAYNGRGNAYTAIRQYDVAIKDYSKAIELDPKYALAYYNRGMAYKALDNKPYAIDDLTKCRSMAKDEALVAVVNYELNELLSRP
jgi:tetratricopeptide (TPR) repeat protein